MDVREEIRAALKRRAGVPPSAPIDFILDAIIDEVSRVARSRTPTGADWLNAVEHLVPLPGTFPMAGEDLSDLNYLLFQLQNARPSGGKGGSGTDQK